MRLIDVKTAAIYRKGGETHVYHQTNRLTPGTAAARRECDLRRPLETGDFAWVEAHGEDQSQVA